ncbi:hypothetical protein NMY22_g15516 [Coprinellus aureogranulatus]|nr:hypothetical protein NMY22_g15516 [Coprinellus aureogranulatus]
MPLSLQPIQNSFDARMHPSNVNAFHHPIHPLQHSQSFDSLNLATPALSECMSIPDSTSSSLINWNGESPILAPQPTQFIDPLNLSIHASFTSDASMQSPVLGSGQQKYLNAVAGGHPRPPSHDQQVPNGDVQWGGPETVYQSAHAIGGMPIMRTSSQHSLGGVDIPQHNPSGSGLQLYDSFGKFHPPMPPAGVTVVPGEYLIRPAEIAPDEVFLMDREPDPLAFRSFGSRSFPYGPSSVQLFLSFPVDYTLISRSPLPRSCASRLPPFSSPFVSSSIASSRLFSSGHPFLSYILIADIYSAKDTPSSPS